MKSIISIIFLLFMEINGFSQYTNVTLGNYDNEPSVIINPKSLNYIVAGANNSTCYYSSDYGISWSHHSMNSTYGEAGDPCFIVDTAGNFYYVHCSSVAGYPTWLDRIVCQKSTDNGHTWNDGSYMGLNPPKQQDKPWAVVNPITNNIYVCWTQDDKYGSSVPTDSSVILFSRSVDGGQNWSSTIRINKVAGNCLDSDSTVEGAVPAVGPNGEIYVSWAGPAGLVFTKSVDGGLTWPNDNVFVTDIPGGWDYNIPGLYRCNGFPVTCCDHSNGPYRGTIYINWSDQRNGPMDTDIFLAKSTDGGVTWNSPKRVNNDPPGKQQFMTWMTVDQVSGILYFVFYDRRNYSDNQTDVYLATSHDGGETFQNFLISENPFTPIPTKFIGDYTNISASDNMVRPIWTRRDGNITYIMTALVDSANTLRIPNVEPALPVSLNQNYPNPVVNETYISFELYKPALVSLEIYNLFGNLTATILHDKLLSPGEYVEELNLTENNISPGIYIYQLTTDDKVVSRKMAVE
jgi:hypothetical protein